MQYLTSEKKIIRSTKTRWTLVFSLTIIVLVSTFAFLIYGLMVRITTERFDESIIERAERIDRRIRLIPVPVREEALVGITDALSMITPNQEFLQFLSIDGELIANVGIQVPSPDLVQEGFEDVKLALSPEASSVNVYRAYTKPLLGPGGRPLFYVRTGVDITDLRQQQNLFLIAMLLTVVLSGTGAWVIGFILSSYILRPLSANYERLKRFSLLSSHELKTPLTIMKSAADLLESDDTISEPSHRKIQMLKNSIGRIESLISQLLLLSQSEESTFLKKHSRVFSLTPFLEDILKRFEPLARNKGIELSLKCSEEVEVNTSEELLQLILQNLIDNALHFTPEGGRVEVAATYLGKGARIAVRDSGIGIRKVDQKRIFERFFKAAPTKRDQSGFGLGLSIVGELAQVIGAEITLTSEPGQGSEFVVTL
jgi:signal transduction histidine kinase